MDSNRDIKKLSFTCDICRRRKVKCNGEHPTCNRCAARGDTCTYSLNPTLSYTARLEQRIKELEAQLEDGAPGGSGQASSSRNNPKKSSPEALQLDSPDIERLGLKIDPKGGITYHGMTSFFNLPVGLHTISDEPVLFPPDQGAVSDARRRETLVANAWRQRALEDLTEIPEPFQYLLNLHWCWVSPLFSSIYRPAFTRDIQTLGPYYSHTLMNAILSHSVRWARSDPAIRAKLDELYDRGAVFGKHARGMVFDELTSGASSVPTTCSVPTVQALLLLSAQECSAGNSAQAWIYSGLAFRIIDHLLICIDGRRYSNSAQLSDEDVEIRHRLFWSCYLWDKIISMYLGRLPTLQHSSVSPPQLVFDDSTDTELWTPFGVPQNGDFEYPPTPAYSTLCFTQGYQLSIIFNEILVHMHDPVKANTQAEMEACLEKEGPALRQWWDNLPLPLRIDTVNPPLVAPPSHIVNLNALYHTFTILLYRPMLSNKQHAAADDWKPQLKQHYLIKCVSAATSIILIFDLFCRTFGIGHCLLTLAYSVYTASSIFLLQIQTGADDGNALPRLDYCVRKLVQVQSLSPVITTPLTMICSQLVELGVSMDIPGMPGPEQEPAGSNFGVPNTHPPDTAPFVDPGQRPAYPPGLFQVPLVESADVEGVSFDPEVLENMSLIDPLSLRVGRID